MPFITDKMNFLQLRVDSYQILLVIAALLNNLVFGFVLLFAIVVMPGLSLLPNDLAYLQAFQAIDGIIQNNQPVFVLTWMGSLLTLVMWAIFECRRRKKLIIPDVGVALLGLVGHVITFAGNVPLNNQLHSMDLDNYDDDSLSQERTIFDKPWNLYNNIRTALFGIVSIYLLVKLLLQNPVSDVRSEKEEEAVTGDGVSTSPYTSYQNTTN